MATKRKPIKPRSPDEEDLLEQSPSELDIEDFLMEWAPQTSVVEIYRRKEDGSMPHIKRVGMDILRADLYGYLRDKFGNGKYILQFKNQNRQIVKNLTVDVEGAPAIVAGNGPSPGGSTFMEQMLLTLIATLKPAPPPPPIDMAAMMTGLGAVLQALKPTPSGDPAAMLAAMAQTFQQLKPPEGGVKQALDLISAAKDLVPGGAREDSDSWPSLIKDGITTVAQVFTNRAPAPGPTRPAVPPGAVPVQIPETFTAQPDITQPAPTHNPEELLKQWITAELDFLKKKARAGKDVEDWVDYVMDNPEEPGCAAILEAMRRGATFQHLLTFDPEIGKDPLLSGWFQRFYEDLSAEFKKAMDTGGPGGDAADPGGDAKPSTE